MQASRQANMRIQDCGTDLLRCSEYLMPELARILDRLQPLRCLLNSRRIRSADSASPLLFTGAVKG